MPFGTRPITTAAPKAPAAVVRKKSRRLLFTEVPFSITGLTFTSVLCKYDRVENEILNIQSYS
jgi:hypothetical protein